MNKNIKALLYSSNIWYLAEGMFGPLLAVFTARIGGDLLDISWAWSIYLVVTGSVMILVGKMVTTKKRAENLLIVGYVLNAILTFGYIFVENPLQLFIIQAALGIATALATPTWNFLYAHHQDKDKGVLEWGLADGEANIITGIAIIVGGMIINFFSFSSLFIVMGTIQAISAGYLIYHYKR